MTQIVTILGCSSLENRILSIALARQSAAQGQKVLLLSQDQSQTLSLLLGTTIGDERQEIQPRLWLEVLKSARLLEKSWDDLKALEAQYIRTPFLKSVYGQELSLLPGMDGALALNVLREVVESGQYDRVIFDGQGGVETLRMFGMPEVLSWYVRRFREVFLASDVAQAALPFLQPLVAAVSNVSWSDSLLKDPDNQMSDLLSRGSAAVGNPRQVVAYLSTNSHKFSVATAQTLWGMAQQVGLTIAGVLNYPHAVVRPDIQSAFAPLNVYGIPFSDVDDLHWAAIEQALPPLGQEQHAPRSLEIDLPNRQVKVFLPGFDKKQVKLTQYGKELTIEAGDQRRNIDLPAALSGKSVAGAKFQDHYLVITLAE